jgi:4-phosphopantoate---beta-alanine ligase
MYLTKKRKTATKKFMKNRTTIYFKTNSRLFSHMNIPKNHPRYLSLMQRHLIEEGVKNGITTPTGMIAQGRGEAFDYLIGEKTHPFAIKAIRVAAAKLLLSEKPVLSVNGNVAALCPKEYIELSNELGCSIEVNLFYGPAERRRRIAVLFEKLGKKILGAGGTKTLPYLSSKRGRMDPKGMLIADTVLVPLEDSDRTECLKKAGKFVIAIDLNPFSRTARMADLCIVDNVVRAVPRLIEEVKRMRKKSVRELQKISKSVVKKKVLNEAEECIRRGAGKSV